MQYFFMVMFESWCKYYTIVWGSKFMYRKYFIILQIKDGNET